MSNARLIIQHFYIPLTIRTFITETLGILNYFVRKLFIEKEFSVNNFFQKWDGLSYSFYNCSRRVVTDEVINLS